MLKKSAKKEIFEMGVLLQLPLNNSFAIPHTKKPGNNEKIFVDGTEFLQKSRPLKREGR
ncbi:MAG: hypothetical protein IPG38_04590 [Chitinophagaceae bacterium]|nr:hypothetical protein [Chitinophagaceae bacterium]